jgi:hypothetical protein
MIDVETARNQVEKCLSRMEALMNPFGSALPGYSDCPKHHLVITREEERDFGWVFCYDSKAHVETGNITAALAGNAPLIVDRVDGQIYVTGTAFPLEHYVSEYRSGKRKLAETDALQIAILPTKLCSTISVLSELLAQKDYERFCGFARSSRLTPGDVRRVIEEYRRCVVPLPDTAYPQINIVPVSGSRPQQWNVIMPVWTEEEGRSDLSLDITLQDSDAKTYSVEINDLHVL